MELFSAVLRFIFFAHQIKESSELNYSKLTFSFQHFHLITWVHVITISHYQPAVASIEPVITVILWQVFTNVIDYCHHSSFGWVYADNLICAPPFDGCGWAEPTYIYFLPTHSKEGDNVCCMEAESMPEPGLTWSLEFSICTWHWCGSWEINPLGGGIEFRVQSEDGFACEQIWRWWMSHDYVCAVCIQTKAVQETRLVIKSIVSCLF